MIGLKPVCVRSQLFLLTQVPLDLLETSWWFKCADDGLTDLNTQAPAQLVTKGYIVNFDYGAIDYCARRNATAECDPAFIWSKAIGFWAGDDRIMKVPL